jgi:FKBP-type peptidyl-prolyl cis-trans isomerase 2
MKKLKKEEKKGDEFVLKFDRRLILVFIVIAAVALAVYLVATRPGTATVKQGDTVLVNYAAKFNDTVIDTNIKEVAEQSKISKKSYEPLNITVGAGKFIKGFEDALYGMKEGEKKTVTIPPELGYGSYDVKKVTGIKNSQLEAQGVNASKLQVGMQLTSTNGVFKVIGKTNDSVFIDMNHPLAGKTVVFDIELLKIKK